MINQTKLLEIKNLKKYFEVPAGYLHAVDDVTFDINKGETLGVVGESGCGKSTLGRTVLRLLEPTAGEVIFEGKNILDYDKKQMVQLRKEIQIIFQDPFSSLNPRKSIKETILEPFYIHNLISKKDRETGSKKAKELMEIVGLASRLINSYPHELDGGRRQRIGIARALALNPKFIVCDEPVSALDVSIQAQILNLMQDLQEKLGLTYMFITHDLSVVKHFSTNIAVMYLGKLVEKTSSDKLFDKPLHPYTQALLKSIPIADIDVKLDRVMLQGEITSPINPKEGCRFEKRCIYSMDICSEVTPELKDIECEHMVACHLYNE